LRPACPCTENCPAIRHVGETCLTTKITRASRGSTKVSVVPRRRFGPEVEIHARDERRLSICRRSGRLPLDEPELPAEDGLEEEEEEEEGPAELPRIEPTVAAAEPTEEVTVGAEGAELVLPAVGAGTAGAGTFGLDCTGTGGAGTVTLGTGAETVGTGTGTVGTGTETVGTGTGTVSARACPATRPAPSKTAAAAKARIPG
jgi:hypothetical protein